jgi:hypothetical protein
MLLGFLVPLGAEHSSSASGLGVGLKKLVAKK